MEILFRGLRPDGKGIVEGDLVTRNAFNVLPVIYDGKENHEVIPETVAQYTNKNADNGQKIFAGQRINCRSYANNPMEIKNALVYWDNDLLCWSIKCEWGTQIKKHTQTEELFRCHSIEIISL